MATIRKMARMSTRCYAVSVNNPAGGQALAQFHRQVLVDVSGQSVASEAGTVGLRFEPGGSFAVLDPATDEPIGVSMAHEQLYAALYSAYRAAEAADEASRPVEQRP